MNTKKVFELYREAKNLNGNDKLEKLLEAIEIAESLYFDNPEDEWTQKAYAYPLIGITNYYVSIKELELAKNYFYQIEEICFSFSDEILENQINLLYPKIDPNYLEVQKAENLSKTGNHKEALTLFKNLKSQDKLTYLHHESYGWALFRYLKAEENNISSENIISLLKEYLYLENERPSILHSSILNFAIKYSRTNVEFSLYNYLTEWNPRLLRKEDFIDGEKDGEKIPSLFSRICKAIVNSNTEINIQDFLTQINLSNEKVLDFLREAFFWKIFNAHKEENFSELWNLFEQYNLRYSTSGPSKWNSEILSLAERLMIEQNELRFFTFFKNWKYENIRDEDWSEIHIDGEKLKPIALKAIQKTFKIITKNNIIQDFSWLIEIYEKAVKIFPSDDWILREKALLYFKNNKIEKAIDLYKKLLLSLSDKYYVWQEFAELISSDNSLKIGMLSKALSLEKNEDFLGDIHLDIAKSLIDDKLIDNALVELDHYKKHRDKKGWKLSDKFFELFEKANTANKTMNNNKELYKKYITIAETFAYNDIEWLEFALVSKNKDDNGKTYFNFTDEKNIKFRINKNRFSQFNDVPLGQIFKFKIHIKEHKYIPLLIEKSEKKNWEILEDAFAVVDYINNDKKTVHVITSDNLSSFFLQIKPELKIGDFLKAKILISERIDKKNIELRNIQKIDKITAISKFSKNIAFIKRVDEQNEKFYYIISSKLNGMISYSDTNLRPKVGDFVNITYTFKENINGNRFVKALFLEPSEFKDPEVIKEISGFLKVNYKNHENKFPDFAFIENIYVPKYLLEKNSIIEDCNVKALAFFDGDKWSIIELKLEN